jgi:Transglutaminase-like superfamily
MAVMGSRGRRRCKRAKAPRSERVCAVSLRVLHRLLRCPWGERLLLFEAFACLGLARTATLLLPFRWLLPLLGQQQHETPTTTTPTFHPTLQAVAHAVAATSRYTPWESACLVQAVTAKLMLKRRGIPSTLYLGVAREGNRLTAHAWLRSGSFVLTGGAGRQRFTIISTFAEKPGSRRLR